MNKKEDLQKAEDELARLSGLDKDDFKSYSVALDEEGLYLWTYDIRRRRKANDSSCAWVWRIRHYIFIDYILSRRYHVVMVDLMDLVDLLDLNLIQNSWGCRRFLYLTKQKEKKLEYDCTIRGGRQMTELDEMVIVCHSFGGYISERYAIRYHEHVKKVVFLLSVEIDKKAQRWWSSCQKFD